MLNPCVCSVWRLKSSRVSLLCPQCARRHYAGAHFVRGGRHEGVLAYVYLSFSQRLTVAKKYDHQTLRPRRFGVRRGPRRCLSLRLLMVFETAYNLEARDRTVRSPGLTPTQVWRPEGLKRVGSAMKRFIFHLFLNVS